MLFGKVDVICRVVRLPKPMEMIERTMSLANIEHIGVIERSLEVAFRGIDGAGQIQTFGEIRGNGGR